ncbi:DUF3842 family protein [Sporolactobacillus vineae]|jgi:hypothetical protein|uniref:DUF3842 family protein n=1 Tax=Sporolactobacillus vineae TaxID=444463 RepID=UPI0004753E86|nr:DUF3842 family protein [Sporolactobacillus vineae]
MKVAVLDGQGAGLGQTLIKKIRLELPPEVQIIALGTNTFATARMVRAGADIGISGEKGICSFCRHETADGIIAPIGIIEPGSIQGEVTAAMTQAFSRMSCRKYLLPLHHPDILVPGTAKTPIKDLAEEIIEDLRSRLTTSRGS